MSKKKEVKETKKEKLEKKKEEKHKLILELSKMRGGTRTFGQRAADKLTSIAGSWGFILSFSAFLIMWMIMNTSWLVFGEPWDVKPFILLNLILSCLAAFQAPIILMSQNRQAQRDRLKSEYDYRINKRAEEEIRDIKNMLMKRYR